ncbi:hypothetical protein EXS71_04815 [Candidatus Uhrbacteria bacterium]|nr:hypothetical protein [Candidatus Uhrbacteria bacterium]
MKDPIRKFPHIIDIGGVKDYLRKKGVQNVDSDPARYPTEAESLDWEKILRKDLEEARRGKDEERRNHIRALLYGLTWELHGPPDQEKLIGYVSQLERWIQTRADALSGRGSSPDDKKEFLDEYRPVIQTIRNALGNNVCGENSRGAVEAIERCSDLAWEGLKQDRPAIIKFLRPLRDQLYYQYVDGTWCETAPKRTATG